MEVISDNIQESAVLIQSKIDKNSLSVFCGAGISVPSGIPTVIPLIKNLLRQLDCSETDLLSFLKNNDFPIPFESIIQVLRETLVYQENKPFLPEFVRLFDAKSNANHYLLAQLFEQQKIKTIITTNFDCCIENAFTNYETRHKQLIVYNEPEKSLRNTEVEGKIIKVHGSTETPLSIGATVDQITKNESFSKNQIILGKVLTSSPAILFLGYSCSDKWDVTRIFNTYTKEEKPEIVFWQHNDGYTKGPTPNQEKIFAGYHCTWMMGNTDELISKLSSLNEITIPNHDFIPAIYPFADLKPLDAHFVLGKLFMAANLFTSAIKHLELFLNQPGRVITGSLNYILATESLADMFRKQYRYEDSQNGFTHAIDLVARLNEASKKEKTFLTARLQRKLAMAFLASGDRVRANRQITAALILLKPYSNTDLDVDHKFQLAETINDFAYLKQKEPEYTTAIENFRSALKIRRQIARIFPQRYLIACSASLSNLGATYHFDNQPRKAIICATKAIDIVRTLADANPTVYLEELSRKFNNLGCIYRDKERHNRKKALENLQGALRIWEQLSIDERDVYYPHVAFTLINMSIVFQKGQINKHVSLNYLDQAIPILIEYQHVEEVIMHFETVANVLKAWSIAPERYFKDKWGLTYPVESVMPVTP